MSDLIPANETISRKALERIIQRAAELQASEREIGDSLTEDQVMELGREVGLPTRYLQQAMLEERTRSTGGQGGWIARIMGPARVMVQRTVRGDREDVSATVSHWMTEEELLTVKRRYKQQTSWEARRDFLASLKRGLGLSGKRYALSRAKEIIGEVRQLEEGWCHVSLAADLTNSRNEYAGGATAMLVGGSAITAIAGVLGVFWAPALLPAVLGAAGGVAVARSRVPLTERVQVSLEQILDRLEHGDVVRKAGTTPPLPTGSQITKMLRDEFRRHLS